MSGGNCSPSNLESRRTPDMKMVCIIFRVSIASIDTTEHKKLPNFSPSRFAPVISLPL